MIKQKIFKKLGATLLVVLMTVPLITACAVATSDSPLTAKEKLPAFLKDVVGIDLTKYDITNVGYGVSYPAKYGGLVMEENIVFTLNSTESVVPVAAVFDNGYIFWLNYYPMRGTILYNKSVSTSAVAETTRILESYKAYAQTYGINTDHIGTALNMLTKASDAARTDQPTGNIGGISNFNTVSSISENIAMTTSASGIGFKYSSNGVNATSKGMGLSYDSNTFTFYDTWGLFSIANTNIMATDEVTYINGEERVLAKSIANTNIMATDEVTKTALAIAQEYYQNITKSSTSTVVTPDWSKATVDVNLVMVPGQNLDDELNNATNSSISSGTAKREPLTLYPYWQTIVNFDAPIGDYSGVQVCIWGDTKELAYVTTYGYLDSFPTNKPDSAPLTEIGNIVIIVGIAAAIAIALTAVAIVRISRRRK